MTAFEAAPLIKPPALRGVSDYRLCAPDPGIVQVPHLWEQRKREATVWPKQLSIRLWTTLQAIITRALSGCMNQLLYDLRRIRRCGAVPISANLTGEIGCYRSAADNDLHLVS